MAISNSVRVADSDIEVPSVKILITAGQNEICVLVFFFSLIWKFLLACVSAFNWIHVIYWKLFLILQCICWKTFRINNCKLLEDNNWWNEYFETLTRPSLLLNSNSMFNIIINWTLQNIKLNNTRTLRLFSIDLSSLGHNLFCTNTRQDWKNYNFFPAWI